MHHTAINDTEIAYEVRGSGDPVVLMHCGFVAQAMAPLLDEPALSNYALINYHRRGYGESARATPPFGIHQQAEDCLALLDRLGIRRAHIVGHSFGANVAIQTALVAPERVQSLALLEPPIPFAMAPGAVAFMTNVMGAAVGKFMAGDAGGAVNDWLAGAFGSGFQDIMERAIPGSTRQMVTDAPASITIEAASLQTWDVTPDDIRRISQPALSVLHVDPVFGGFQQTHEALMRWLPQCEALTIPDTTHLLQIHQPRAVAEGLAAFLARHSIAQSELPREALRPTGAPRRYALPRRET